MPKIEHICSDEEDDIWEYRSQPPKGRKFQNDALSQNTSGNGLRDRKLAKPSMKSLGKRKSTLSQRRVKTDDEDLVTANKSQKQKRRRQNMKVKREVKIESTPNAKQAADRSGRCPVCQMPFALLSAIETPSWHIDQCLDVPYSSKNECQASLDCNCEIASHYKKFRHTRLARSRRKNETVKQRDKGDVDSAKTKLSFDTNSNGTKLVVPGSSAECVIEIDSSQDSNFSQRSNDDALDDTLPSVGDEIDGVLTEQNGDAMKGLVSKKKSGKEKVLDKNKNYLEGYKGKAKKQSVEKLFGRKLEDEDMYSSSDEDYESLKLKTVGGNANVSAGLTRVETIDLSYDSYGSVEDINNIVDDTRSLSEMINDALDTDNVTAAEDSEVDNVEAENKQIIKKRSNWNEGDDYSEIDNVSNERDDDPVIDLFTDRPTKPSAISSLRETPAKSPESDSSSDWEILRTTLTQPTFQEKDVEQELSKKTVLRENSSQFYKESMKTPCKDFGKVGASESNSKNETGKSDEKHKELHRGFFATKMLQNTRSCKSNVNYDDSPCLEEKEESHPDKQNFNAGEQSKRKNHQEIIVKSSVQASKTVLDTKRKNRNGMRKLNRPSRDISEGVHSSGRYEKLMDKDEETTTSLTSFRLGSTRLKSSVSVKEEFEGSEMVEKKPKIEIKPKTPTKRKLGKNTSKHQKVKKENCSSSRQKTVASFFKPNEIKSEVPIHTDSDSSENCERLNNIGRFAKCCAKCIEEQGCWSNYVEPMNGRDVISSAGGSPSLSSQTNKLHGRGNTSCTSSHCTNSLHTSSSDYLSNVDKCSTMHSLSSSTVTSCRGCGSCQSSVYSNFSSGKTPCNRLQSQNSRTKSSSSKTSSGDNLTQSCTQGSCHVCSPHHLKTSSGHIKCHVCAKQSPSQTGSKQNSFPTCFQPSPNQIGSQQSQGLGSQTKRSCCGQNNSLNNTGSTCSLQFNIENVCTLSQNTYTDIGEGFMIENSDNVGETVNTPHCANCVNNDAPVANIASQQTVESTSSASGTDKEVGSILQIRKSATDILMASSRLLFSKSAKHNAANSGKLKQGGTSGTLSVNDVLMGKSADMSIQPSSKKQTENSSQGGQSWKGGRVPTSTEVSDDSNEVKRKCPFYKKIPDTCMTVDAFRYGNIPDCRAYVLSHFHYDHYMGLKKQFRNPMYCSKITGNLVKKKIGVDNKYINTIPLNTPTVVENVEITFLEANHCPGAVLILFKLKSGRVYLHTGDFRACLAMESYPQLQNLKIHTLYLDTTYCDPQYDFPPQKEVIPFAVKLALDALTNNPKTLIVCGSYSIGKERIFTAIAEELDCKICVTRDKKTVLDSMEDEQLKQRVSLKWEDSCLHVLPMNKINYQGLFEHLLLNGKRYNSVLGIEPTGWTHSKKNLSLYHIKPKVSRDNIKIYGIPYSEHSSFLELKRFVQFTKPDKILATVNNGNVHSRRKMEVIFEAWMEELRSRRTATSTQSSITGWTK